VGGINPLNTNICSFVTLNGGHPNCSPKCGPQNLGPWELAPGAAANTRSQATPQRRRAYREELRRRTFVRVKGAANAIIIILLLF